MGRNNGSSHPAAKTEGYVDVERIENGDNLFAVISQRKYDLTYTFGVFRSYVQNDEHKQTSFVPEHLVESYIELVKSVGVRIGELRRASRSSASAPAKAAP